MAVYIRWKTQLSGIVCGCAHFATRNTSPCAVLRQRPLQEGLPEALRQALRYCLVLEGHPSKGLLCQPQNAITGLFLLEFLSMSFLNLLFVFLVMIGFLCDHYPISVTPRFTIWGQSCTPDSWLEQFLCVTTMVALQGAGGGSAGTPASTLLLATATILVASR